ncbi:MAG: DUF4349 domain-containing protein [Thermoguttaceae bacterium]|jgi:hypothetical protein|nr:DUF4349 domain-containing protein [Thermoguttaceae bacterium]
MRTLVILPAALLGLAVFGCGAASDPAQRNADEAAAVPTSPVGTPADDVPTARIEPVTGQASGEPDGGNEAIRRKIVYQATLDLVVEDFSAVSEQVETLAKRHGGFVAYSSLSGATGSPRTGTWKVRVPATNYGTFLQEAQRLGEFQTLQSESEEVTVEFYDVESRIRNRKASEERLLALLRESAGHLDDVLKIEQHLSRVREEIERLEGRLRVLGDLTAFCTVTITARETRGYVPPQVATFRQRAHRAWTGSLSSLVVTGENLAVLLIVLAPWLAVLAILSACVFTARRALRPRRAGSAHGIDNSKDD